MGEDFFHGWSKDFVCSVIESTYGWPSDDAKLRKVKEELTKLQGAGSKLKEYLLRIDAPDCLKSPEVKTNGENYWFDYIKPVLKSLQKEKYRRFNDPIHGTIELHPLLCKIIDTPEFHRLNDIKQLGGVHYVYSNARHTRFEHSIGVCYLAGEFARMLKKKQPELDITDKDILCVEIAGLIHDLGHGPFSHMFEYGIYEQLKLEYPKDFQQDQKWEHEMLSKRVFQEKIYKKLKSEFDDYGITGLDSGNGSESDVYFITELIHYDVKKLSRPTKAFLYQIVANKYCGIDVDKWDYFARDGHFIGIAHDFDFRRLMSMSRVIRVEGGKWMICFRTKEMNNIYGMFRTRCSLFQRALHHNIKINAELMLCRAVALAAEAITLSAYTLSEDGTLQQKSHESLLSAVVNAQKYTKDPSTGSLEGFLALTDSIIYAIKVANSEGLPAEPQARLKEAQKLLLRIPERNMFHEVKLEGVPGLPDATTTHRHLMEHATSELQATLDKQLKDLGPRSVFVQLVNYKYGSEPVENKQNPQSSDESVLNLNDPVRKVYFYEKLKPKEALPGEHPDLKRQMQEPTTGLVRPKEFSVSQWKVYSDLEEKEDEKIIEVIKEFLSDQTGKQQMDNN